MNDGRYPHPGPLYPGAIYPGNGYPPNRGEDRDGLSPFGRLAKGQPLGKSSILIYDSGSADLQTSAVDMLQIEGDDLDACQLYVTLAPPRVIPLDYAEVLLRLDKQGLSMEQDNSEITAGLFPGNLAPIAWPPFEAVLEWGVRGASARAVVDFVNGATVNVIASFLRVHAVVSQNELSGEISGTSAAYYLAAFVGPGFMQTGTAKRTVYIGTISPNTESDVFDVPKFARSALLVGCDQSSPPNVTVGYIRFWQSPNGAPGGTNVGNFFQSGNQPGPFGVPNAASYFSVFTHGAAATMKYSVIFELAL